MFVYLTGKLHSIFCLCRPEMATSLFSCIVPWQRQSGSKKKKEKKKSLLVVGHTQFLQYNTIKTTKMPNNHPKDLNYSDGWIDTEVSIPELYSIVLIIHKIKNLNFDVSVMSGNVYH